MAVSSFIEQPQDHDALLGPDTSAELHLGRPSALPTALLWSAPACPGRGRRNLPSKACQDRTVAGTRFHMWRQALGGFTDGAGVRQRRRCYFCTRSLRRRHPLEPGPFAPDPITARWLELGWKEGEQIGIQRSATYRMPFVPARRRCRVQFWGQDQRCAGFLDASRSPVTRRVHDYICTHCTYQLLRTAGAANSGS